AHARDQVTHGHSRVAGLEIHRVVEEIHEGDQSAVAPAHNADALGIEVVVVFQHELPAGKDVFDLQPAVVEQLPELAAVAGTPAVVGGNDRVALLKQLAKDLDVVGSEVAMDAAVREHHQRQLLAGKVFLGQEGVGRDDYRVPGAGRGRVLRDARGRS